MKFKSIIFTTIVSIFVVFGCKIPKEFLSGLNTTPNPLELRGGKIECKVEGVFPEKYFVKNLEMTIVPILKSKKTDAVLRGTPKVYQGEKVRANNTVINYKKGGKYEQFVSFDYSPEFDQCELYMEATAKVKIKVIKFEPVKVAEGLITTENWIYSNSAELGSKIIEDKFQQVIEQKEEAEIKFLIQQSNIRQSEKKGILELTNKIKEAKSDNNMVIKGLEISSYASPDGGIELNEKIAAAREKATKKYVDNQMNKIKTQLDISGKFTAQDWEGFKNLMENSDIEDKNLIISVLSMYSDPEQREKEIKNLSTAFTEIKDKILPQLRRSKLILTKEMTGKSDETILDIIKNNPSQLNVEEMLYAASLLDNIAYKKDVYQKVIKYFPNDVRGHNNLGVVEYNLGNVDVAEKYYRDALNLDANNPTVNLNMGSLFISKRDLDQAKTYLGNAAGVGENLDNVNGILSIAEGNYNKAASLLKNQNTNNAALSQILIKDYSKAKNILDNIKIPDAKTYYLYSIIAARTNNISDLMQNAVNAINADKSMKNKFINDPEFSSYISNNAFNALLK